MVVIDRPTNQAFLDKAFGRIGLTCRTAPFGRGVEVLGLCRGSIAADAGLHAGDTILSINGTLVESHEHAIELIDEDIETAEIVWHADNRTVEIVKGHMGKKLGLTVTNNPEGSGVVVVGLELGGLARDMMSVGEVILAVDGEFAEDHARTIELVDGNDDVLTFLLGPPVADLDHVLQNASRYGWSKEVDPCEIAVNVPQPLVDRTQCRSTASAFSTPLQTI